MPFLTDLEKVLLDRDSERWRSFLNQVSLVAPRGSLGKGPSIGGQSDLIDAFAPMLRGLSADEVPDPHSPHLFLFMQRLMHLTAKHFLEGRDDKFNGTFCHGLSNSIGPGAEQREFELLVETIFLPRERLTGPLRFLANPDTYRSFVSLDRLRTILKTEEETGLLARLSRDLLSGDQWDRIYGGEILRLLRFLQLLEAEGLGLYYWEYAT